MIIKALDPLVYLVWNWELFVDTYVSDLSEDRDRRSTLLICLRGEVPVILDSPIEEATFFNAQRDDVACIDNLGSVCLLSSINLGNCSETRAGGRSRRPT